MDVHTFSHVKEEFLVTATILYASVDFQYLWAIVSVLSAWWTRRFWEFEFERSAERLLSLDNTVWGFGERMVFCMYLFLHRKSREIELSLHKVMDNKYTNMHACIHNLKDGHAHIFPLLYSVLPIPYKNKQPFQKSRWFSFFPTQVLPNSVKFLDFLLLENFPKEFEKVTEIQA